MQLCNFSFSVDDEQSFKNRDRQNKIRFHVLNKIVHFMQIQYVEYSLNWNIHKRWPKITLTSNVIFWDRKHPRCEAAEKKWQHSFSHQCVFWSFILNYLASFSLFNRRKTQFPVLHCTLGLALKCLCTLSLSRGLLPSLDEQVQAGLLGNKRQVGQAYTEAPLEQQPPGDLAASHSPVSPNTISLPWFTQPNCQSVESLTK